MIEIANIGLDIYFAIILFGILLPISICIWREVLKGK